MADVTRGTEGGWFRAPASGLRRGHGESTLTVRGTTASLLWGYRTAVTLKAWAIFKAKGQWTLTATLDRVDAFQARQRPLLFTAPRPGGFWAWPLESLELGDRQLRATLGPPER